MKGKKKYIMPLLLAGVTATGVVVDVQQSINTLATEKTQISNVALSVEGGFKGEDGNTSTTFNVGKVYLPSVKYNNNDAAVLGTDYDFEIYKGVNEIDYATDGKGVYFDATYVGYYTIKVVDLNNKDTDHNVIHEMKVLIEKGDAVINLPINSEYVVPAKVPAKLAGLPQSEIKVPVPTITIGDDEKETEVGDLASGNTLVVELMTPTTTKTLELVTNVGEDEEPYYKIPGGDNGYLSDIGTYQIVYTYKEGQSVISRLESSFAVVNSNKFDLDDIDLHMTFLKSVPTTGNINSKVEIPGVKVTETVTSLDQVNCHLEMTVKNQKTKKVFPVEYNKETGKYYFIPTEKGYYTISYKARIDLFGKETVLVTPGNPIEVKDTEKPVLRPTYEYTSVDNGTDSEGRSLKKITTVNGKDVDAEWNNAKTTDANITRDEVVEKLLADRRVVIPSVAIMNKQETTDGKAVDYAEVVLPAIYATDNYDYFNEMTYTRTLRTSGGSYKTLYTNEDEKKDDYTKNLTVKLYNSGNNEIRYKVTDRAGNTLGEVIYDIYVYENVTETADELAKGKTSLDLVLGRTSVSNLDKTFEFDKPIVTDTYDEYVEVKTFYKEIKGTATGNEELIELTSENIKSNGKYEIDLTKLDQNVTGLQFVVKAYIDGALINTREAFKNLDPSKITAEGQIEIEYSEEEIKLIQVLNSNLDTEAPEFETAADVWYTDLISNNSTSLYDYKDAEYDKDGQVSVPAVPSQIVGLDEEGWAKNSSGTITVDGFKVAPFDQGNDVINIPSVTFTDDYDANLKISMIITDTEGNVVLKDTNETVTRSENAPYTYTVSGAKLKLNSYGIYTVTYKAEDVGGNVVVKNFGIRVNDKTAPTIIITEESSFGQEIEVYEFYKFPAAKLVKNNQTDPEGKFNIRVQALGGAKIASQSQSGFTPASEGTFLIIYEATDSSTGLTTSIEDSSFSVTAKATKKPEITIYNDITFPSIVPTFTKDEGKNYMTIEIPNATAIDTQINAEADLTITVSGPNSSKPTVKNGTTLGTKEFEATAEGEYTVTYKAVSDFGVETTEVKTIKVGDCVKPTIDWSNQVTKVNLGEDFILKFADIELDDDKTSESNLADELTVTLKGPSGDVVDLKKQSPGVEYAWNLAETGNYTLTLTVKDGAKNSTTQTYKIEVPEEEVDSEVISPALGTVLVVLSVVVLAGVVVYFVATSKKKGHAVKTSRKNK